jgi:predicted permease
VLPRGFPRVGEVGIDSGVLLFTMAISIVAGVLAGLTPALKAARPDVHDALKEGGRGPSTTRYRAQAVFVVVQIAMALVLLVGASLLVRTLMRLSSETPGFDPDGVVTMGLSLSPSMRDAEPERIRAELRRVKDALEAVPGVVATSYSWGGVPVEVDDQTHFRRDDRPEPPSQNDLPWTQRFVVGPDYLATMQIRLVRGRFFTARDNENVPMVMVIDEVFAQTHYPGEDPVGKYLRVGDDDFENPIEIIGVVSHVKQWGLDRDGTTAVRAQSYQSFLQLGDNAVAEMPNGVVVLARVHGDTGAAVQSLRQVVNGLGAENVMYRVRTVNEIVAGYQATRRFSMYVLTAFAVLALLLSCIGIYGVVSYVVTQRTSEIGIRMALGARPGHIMGMVLRQGAKLALAGVALGLVAAAAVAPSLGDLIYGVPAIDPVTFVLVPCAVTVVALAAMVLPARRAMRVDPLLALRSD